MDGRRPAPYVVDDDSDNSDCSDGDRNNSDDDDYDDDDDDIVNNCNTFLFNPVRHHILASTMRTFQNLSLQHIFFVSLKFPKPPADRGTANYV